MIKENCIVVIPPEKTTRPTYLNANRNDIVIFTLTQMIYFEKQNWLILPSSLEVTKGLYIVCCCQTCNFILTFVKDCQTEQLHFVWK